MQKPKAKMQPKAPGEWTTGLWGCFSDWGNCITTLFCPCITYGQIANIVQKGKTSVFTEARNYATIMYFTGGCCLYSCFSRSKLRHKYNLPQSPCSLPDCAVHFCCELCALCQEYSELQGRGFNMAIGFDLNPTDQDGMINAASIDQVMTQINTLTNQDGTTNAAPATQVMTQADTTNNHQNDHHDDYQE
ncbi:hypothetical protein ACET3Z_012842 [Daucus carota]